MNINHLTTIAFELAGGNFSLWKTSLSTLAPINFRFSEAEISPVAFNPVYKSRADRCSGADTI